MIDSEVRNMNPLLGKSISRNKRSQFIVETHRDDKSNLTVKIVAF